jgi:glutathione S-transferase
MIASTASKTDSRLRRYALNYKGIPFQTELIEYPDIEPVSKRIGAKPTGTHPDGRLMYTIPFIYNENTKTAVSNTIDIAIYLDKQFPDTPRIVQPGTKGLQLAFIDASFKIIGDWSRPLWWSFLAGTSEKAPLLNKSTLDYLTGKLGLPHEIPSDEYMKRVELGEADFAKIAAWYGEEDIFITGTEPSIADFTVAAVIMGARVIWGEKSDYYQKMCSWQDGRWGKLMAALRKYE